MNTLVIVATLLSCSLAAPSGLLHGLHGLPLAHTGLPLAYHGLPLVKAAEGDEVKAHVLPYLPALPYHHAPAIIAPAEEAEAKEAEVLPLIHAAPYLHALPYHHAPVEVKEIEIKEGVAHLEGAALPGYAPVVVRHDYAPVVVPHGALPLAYPLAVKAEEAEEE